MHRTARGEMRPHRSQLLLELTLTVLNDPSLHPLRARIRNDEKISLWGTRP